MNARKIRAITLFVLADRFKDQAEANEHDAPDPDIREYKVSNPLTVTISICDPDKSEKDSLELVFDLPHSEIETVTFGTDDELLKLVGKTLRLEGM